MEMWLLSISKWNINHTTSTSLWGSIWCILNDWLASLSSNWWVSNSSLSWVNWVCIFSLWIASCESYITIIGSHFTNSWISHSTHTNRNIRVWSLSPWLNKALNLSKGWLRLICLSNWEWNINCFTNTSLWSSVWCIFWFPIFIMFTTNRWIWVG